MSHCDLGRRWSEEHFGDPNARTWYAHSPLVKRIPTIDANACYTLWSHDFMHLYPQKLFSKNAVLLSRDLRILSSSKDVSSRVERLVKNRTYC